MYDKCLLASLVVPFGLLIERNVKINNTHAQLAFNSNKKNCLCKTKNSERQVTVIWVSKRTTATGMDAASQRIIGKILKFRRDHCLGSIMSGVRFEEEDHFGEEK